MHKPYIHFFKNHTVKLNRNTNVNTIPCKSNSKIFYNLSSWPIHKPSMRFLDLCYNKAEDNLNNIAH